MAGEKAERAASDEGRQATTAARGQVMAPYRLVRRGKDNVLWLREAARVREGRIPKSAGCGEGGCAAQGL